LRRSHWSAITRIKIAFSALVFTQIAHSTEEYVGRLWESFPPARFLTGMISSDRELGFIVLNSALVAFGVWCLLFPVRKEWPSATGFIWFWIVLEIVNGVASRVDPTAGWVHSRSPNRPGASRNRLVPRIPTAKTGTRAFASPPFSTEAMTTGARFPTPEYNSNDHSRRKFRCMHASL
jgi:hypothetical protein